MWRIKRITQRSLLAVLLVTFGCTAFARVQADTTAVPSLTISQLKITSSNGQFVTLYNPTNSTLDMSKYQLEYFNSFDINKATSSKLLSLTGMLPPHSYFMINDGTLQVCFQMTLQSASLGFSSTSGMVEVLSVGQSSPGGLISSGLQDYVGWSKTTVSGTQTLPVSTNAFLQRQPIDAQNNPAVAQAGGGSWLAVQRDTSSSCGLVTVANPTNGNISSGLNQLLPTSDALASSAVADPGIGTGSVATYSNPTEPQITELLPNPAGTGTDATKEFIELYNPNDTVYDLSGYKLQVGLSTKRSYTFPAASYLMAGSYTAFYPTQTGLVLSNNGSQASLLDPDGNVVSVTDQYSTAPDGQAWVLTEYTWQWTTQPSPGASNAIVQPPVAAPMPVPVAAVTQHKLPAVKTVTAAKLKTAKKPKVASAKHKSTLPPSKTAALAAPKTVPIHPWELALVGGLALLYGVYEYRNDLGGLMRKCGAKLGFGDSHGPEPARRRSD